MRPSSFELVFNYEEIVYLWLFIHYFIEKYCRNSVLETNVNS